MVQLPFLGSVFIRLNQRFDPPGIRFLDIQPEFMLGYGEPKSVPTRLPTSQDSGRPANPDLRVATVCAFLVAGSLLAIWFWSRICRFPTIAWNDMRLAPTIALAQGWPVYPTATEGTISTWMYGPLPLLFFWPASWASSAADALMIAAFLNVALTVVPLVLVCLRWPAVNAECDAIVPRLAAVLICLALWPELHYSVHFSDNLAVAFGLIGNLMLVRARGSTGLWLAAFSATAAIACKQIAVGIPLAQVIWLAATEGRQSAARHVLRCITAGVTIGLSAIGIFGARGLWFTLIEIPGGLGWAVQPWERLKQIGPVLLLHIGAPLSVMIAARGIFAEKAPRLAAIAWACSLPLGIAGLMKLGGWTNSIHSFVLWLPPVLVSLLTARAFERHIQLICLGGGIAAAAIATLRVVNEAKLSLRPQVAAYHEADRLAAQFPGRLWFPLHPLVTLYRDHRYYHDEDGLYARRSAQKPLSGAQLAAYLPRSMEALVLRYGTNDWGIARGMQPSYTQSSELPHWTLWSQSAYTPLPIGQPANSKPVLVSP